MFNDLLLDHFRNPRNAGRLEQPAISVEASNPACGDTLCLAARFEDGIAVEVRYLAKGCAAAVAAGSALTELIRGRRASELDSIGAAEVEAALGGLPPASRHAAALAADAVKALAAQWRAKESGPLSR